MVQHIHFLTGEDHGGQCVCGVYLCLVKHPTRRINCMLEKGHLDDHHNPASATNPQQYPGIKWTNLKN